MQRRHYDEDEEFDDPMILQQQKLNKQQPRGGQGGQPGMEGMPMGGPGGMPMGGMPMGGQGGMPMGGMPMGGPGGMPMGGMPMGGMPPQGQQAEHQQPIDRSLSIYELCMIGFFLLFLLNCYLGKRTNEGFAYRWCRANEEFFNENYSHIGFDREYNVGVTAPIL
jgi:hypothetical protein